MIMQELQGIDTPQISDFAVGVGVGLGLGTAIGIALVIAFC